MAHHEYVEPHKPRSRTVIVFGAIGRALALVVQVIGAVGRGAAGGGGAPMTPQQHQQQLPANRPDDYRP